MFPQNAVTACLCLKLTVSPCTVPVKHLTFPSLSEWRETSLQVGDSGGLTVTWVWLLSLQQDAAVVLLHIFMKNWHKWIPGLFLLVLAPGICIAFLVFSYSAPQHSWLQRYQERGVDVDYKSPAGYVVVVCMPRSFKMAVLLLFVHALLESPCFIYTLLTRMCLPPCPKDASLQETWSCHFHV